MSLAENASTPIWANFLDLANDVKPFLRLIASDSSDDVMLALVRDMACQWVQDYLGRPVGPTSFDRRFNGWAGWNGAYIELPYYPVLEITSCVEYWGISGPHVLVESPPTAQVDGFQCDYLRGTLIRVFPGNVQKPWFPGSRNIEVKWKAGYNPIPAPLKAAGLALTAHWWRKWEQASRGGTTSVDKAGNAGALWRGVPDDVTAMLSPYLQVGIG